MLSNVPTNSKFATKGVFVLLGSGFMNAESGFRGMKPWDVGIVLRIEDWLRAGTWKMAQPRGTKSHLCKLLTKKSGFRAERSRSRCPMPWAPSMRLRMPSWWQAAVRASKGMRTPGRELTVSKMARRGRRPAARESWMALVNLEMRAASSMG